MPINSEHAFDPIFHGIAHNARTYFRRVVENEFTRPGGDISAGDLRYFDPTENPRRRDYELRKRLSTYSADLGRAAGAKSQRDNELLDSSVEDAPGRRTISMQEVLDENHGIVRAITPRQRSASMPEMRYENPERWKVTGHITHQYLEEVSKPQIAELSQEQRDVIKAYSMNSVPFHHATRGQKFWREYANMAPETLEKYFGVKPPLPRDDHEVAESTTDGDLELVQRTINELNGALHALPHADYDVSWWSNRYYGKMAFRGTKVGHPYDEGRVVYLSDARSAIEQELIRKGSMPSQTAGMIREGALVTNTDFMSTSAQPQVAAEFGIRLMDVPAGPDGIDDRSAPENRTPGLRIKEEDYTIGDHLGMNENRVFFRIDHKSGRNICAETTEKQAEILFPQGRLFAVKSISRSHDLGNIVDLVEMDPKDHVPGQEVRNMMTGRLETDWFRARQASAKP